MFTQTAFQDALIAKLDHIECYGIGEHKRRSHAAACAKARQQLVRLGYTEQQAAEIVEQAREMFKLERLCND